MGPRHASDSSGRRRARSPWRTGRGPLALLIVLPVALACREPASDVPQPGAGVGRAPSTVVLVSIDTLRADRVGAYGHARPTTPHLDALASDGVLFEQVAAPSPWTLPSHGSILTGRYPRGHGLRFADSSLPEGVPTLAELLRDAGWSTAAFVNSIYLSEKHGLARGFETFQYVRESVARVRPMRFVTDRGLDWLASGPSSPRFVFLHYYDVHSDYRSLPRFEARFVGPYQGHFDGSTEQLLGLRREKGGFDEADVAHLLDRYDAGVAQMDHELGRLLDGLRASPDWSDTLVIVTSDHGEEFAEHGGFLHGRTQYQEVQSVPLVLRGPGLPRGRRVAQPVSLVDLLPTVLAMAGLPAPPAVAGLDLAPAIEGRTLPARVLFGEADHHNARADITRSARLGRHKLVVNRLTGHRALYDLEADPGERHDRSELDVPVLGRLRRALRDFEASEQVAAVDTELSAEERAPLEALGYLQPGSGGAAGEGAAKAAEPR